MARIEQDGRGAANSSVVVVVAVATIPKKCKHHLQRKERPRRAGILDDIAKTLGSFALIARFAKARFLLRHPTR